MWKPGPPFRCVLLENPPVARPPRQPLSRIPWHFLLALLPLPGPASHRRQGLGTGQMGASRGPGPPTALPAPGGGDEQQHGPVLFHVEIKGRFTSRVVCLLSSCWLAAGALAVGTHVAHPDCVTHPVPREWVEECVMVPRSPHTVAGRGQS